MVPFKLTQAESKEFADLPTPHDVKSLRHFLGMAQFCERFISNFSVISAPLHDLTEPNVPYVWSKTCQEAFSTIKDLLTSAPVLRAPDSCDYFILETDASDKGEGVCLKARSHLDHQRYIVAYGSHKFDETEERWNIVEKEAHNPLWCKEIPPLLIWKVLSIAH